MSEKKGPLRTINIRGPTSGAENEDLRPRPGRKLRILGGTVGHITGTNTYLSIALPSAGNQLAVIFIDNAVASGNFGLNDRITTNTLHMLDTKDLWIIAPAFLLFYGAALAGADIQVEELPVET